MYKNCKTNKYQFHEQNSHLSTHHLSLCPVGCLIDYELTDRRAYCHKLKYVIEIHKYSQLNNQQLQVCYILAHLEKRSRSCHLFYMLWTIKAAVCKDGISYSITAQSRTIFQMPCPLQITLYLLLNTFGKQTKKLIFHLSIYIS